MPGKMEFADSIDRQCLQIILRIETMDVAHDPAAGSTRHGSHEFPLRDGRMAIAQIRGRVLDQDASPEIILCRVHVSADNMQRLLCHRQR